MGTTTLLALEKLLSEAIGDDLEFDASSVITTSTGTSVSFLATTLQNYDNGRNDYFNRQWVYFTEDANAGVLRNIKDYISTAGRVFVRGVDLAATTSTAAVTCRIHRLNRSKKILALKRAIEQIYPNIYIPLDNRELITGNILPDGFQWWSSATALQFYTATNTTLAQTTTATFIRGLKYSAKSTASAANGNISISSNTYKRLLDLQGRTVSIYVWAYPEVLDDCTIIIDTVSNDGTTTQTLTSTTSCPLKYWTLIEFEDQALNDDLQEVKITFNTETINKYTYWADPMLLGRDKLEYLLPENFQEDSHVSQIHLQTSGYSDQVAYDLNALNWGAKQEFTPFWEEVNGIRYKFIRLLDRPQVSRRMKLTGYKKLEIPTTDAGTISLDGAKLNVLIAYAAHLLYEMEKGTASTDDRSEMERESAYWLAKYHKILPQLMMMRPSDTLRTGV